MFPFPEPMVLDVAMSKTSWQHHVRLLWRVREWVLGAERAGWNLDNRRIDWHISLRGPKGRSTWMQTIQANGLNSRSRAARHFGSALSAACEHGCGEEDHFEHRFLNCEALRRARIMTGINNADEDYLRNMPSATTRGLWWVHPIGIDRDIWPNSQHWGLWVNAEWIQIAQQDKSDADIQLVFTYAGWKAGDHPQVQRHGAQLCNLDDGWAIRHARALQSEISRKDWEADAMLQAAALVLATGRQVQVHGLAKTGEWLWNYICDGHSSQRNLASLLVAARNRVLVENTQQPPAEGLLEYIRIHPDSVAAWNYSWCLASKVATLLPSTHELFPLAAEISRRHGERGERS